MFTNDVKTESKVLNSLVAHWHKIATDEDFHFEAVLPGQRRTGLVLMLLQPLLAAVCGTLLQMLGHHQVQTAASGR